MKEKMNKIIGHGIQCFERLALVTGGENASTFDNPESVKLGQCELIEDIIIGEDILIKFSGVAMWQACTIVLRATMFLMRLRGHCMMPCVCYLRQPMTVGCYLEAGGLKW